MSEIRKTVNFASLAVLLAILALATAPRRATPDALADLSEPFFPDFEDPNTAVSLEVIEFGEETAAAKPFKVTSQAGKWSIPSHYDYPADGKDRLAQTAAGIIQLRKDDFRSDSASDQEICGVVDPLDETAVSLKGRGTRITIKGENDQILADLIVGKKLDDREAFRFVRLPGQKRIYAARFEVELSTQFQDWIEKDLLLVEKSKIDKLVLKDYSIDERRSLVVRRDTLSLEMKAGKWEADKMDSDQEVDSFKVGELLGALDELSIVGVRPKPSGLSQGLRRLDEEGMRITVSEQRDLASKGYYFTQDGSLLSNEGELQARTSEGILYTLRFGEILYGQGEAVSAGGESSDDPEAGPGENRYLFITAEFVPDGADEPPQPADTQFESRPQEEWTAADRENKRLQDAYDTWKATVEEGQKEADELTDRFANWYYVIPSSAFDKLHLTRKDLVKEKASS